jgi:hypothetical protein
LISGFSALLIGLGFVSAGLRPLTRSTELFFLISALFAILTLLIQKLGTVSLVGGVTGLTFFAIPGAPFPLHIATALISNAVVFDFYLKTAGSRPLSSRSIGLAAAVGSFVMAVATLLLLQTLGTTIPLAVWVVAPPIDTAVGWVGARFGLVVAGRIRSSAGITRTL